MRLYTLTLIAGVLKKILTACLCAECARVALESLYFAAFPWSPLFDWLEPLLELTLIGALTAPTIRKAYLGRSLGPPTTLTPKQLILRLARPFQSVALILSLLLLIFIGYGYFITYNDQQSGGYFRFTTLPSPPGVPGTFTRISRFWFLLEKGELWVHADTFIRKPSRAPVPPGSGIEFPMHASLGTGNFSRYDAQKYWGVFLTRFTGFNADLSIDAEGPCVSASLPLWLAIVPPVLIYLGSVRRMTPSSTGICRSCSYDLRAHTSSQRCPECGTPIQEPVVQ